MSSAIGIEPIWLLVTLLRVVLLGLALGMTLISYRAFARRRTPQLKYAFVGFAFVSMGVAVSMLLTQLRLTMPSVQALETIPFIIGFAMLYLSMYR